MPRRIFEVQKGYIALAAHLHQAYWLLLKLDTKRRKHFRVVGVSGYLCREMGYKIGFAAYVGLMKTGLIRSLGRVTGHGRGNLSSFMVYRRPCRLLSVDYHERKSSPRGSHGPHRVARKKRVSGVGAYHPARTKQSKPAGRETAFEPSKRLLIALLKHAGEDPRVLPKKTIVHFFFD